MKFSALVSIIALLSISVLFAEGRDLRVDASPGVLLTALCVEDGRLREACLEGISTVSIQKLLDRVIAQIKDNRPFGTLLSELNMPSDDSEERVDDILPQKRGRNRGQSGFYSNW